MSSVPSDVDVTSPSIYPSATGGWEKASRDRFEDLTSPAESVSVWTGAFSRETRRLFFRVFASVSVWGALEEVEDEDVPDVPDDSRSDMLCAFLYPIGVGSCGLWAGIRGHPGIF